MVGVSGSAGDRVADVTASARNLPALICGSDGGRLSNMSCTWPPIRSCSAGRAALVRDVRHLHAGHHLEQLAREMDRRAVARRREIELAGIRLRVGDELLHRVHRQRRIDHEHVGNAGDQDDRREILDVVVRHLRVQARVDRVRAHGAHFQRVAVGRGLGDQLRADVAAGAGPVVDDDRLAPCVGELLRDGAGEDVGGAARRERHDEADRLRRIGLRPGARRERREQHQANGDCG